MLNATLLKKVEVTPELVVFSVRPDEGVPEFRSGQYVAVGLPGSAPRVGWSSAEKEPAAADKIIKRAYSIGSSPSARESLEFYIAIVPDGALTPRLAQLAVGERLFVAPKITGTFTLESVPANENLILASTGTGLAPFVSMVRSPELWTPGRKVTIIHGVRYSKDLGYREELLALEKQQPAFRYLPIVSRQDSEWSGATGRIQRLFTDAVVTPDPTQDHIFLCGNPEMITEREAALVAQGYSVHSKKNPTGKLHIEKYW